MKKTLLIAFLLLLAENVANSQNWIQKTDLTGAARSGAVGFSIGSKGYIGTGNDVNANELKDFWEYDPSTNTWTQKTDFGGHARYGAVGFSIGAKGYIGTGGYYDTLNSVFIDLYDFWEYNPSTNIWTQKTIFSGGGRKGAVGFSIGTKGYVGTGNSNGGTLYTDFYEYDPATNTWISGIANFGGSAGDYKVGFSIGNKGYIGTGGNSKEFYEYDTTNNSWTQKADFGGDGRDYAIGFSIGSKGFIGTGYHAAFLSSYKKDFWEYDPSTNAWSQKTDFGGIERGFAVGFSIGTKGYIGTASSNISGAGKDFWQYDICSLMNLFIIKTDVACNGGNDGSATVYPNGGESPYTYQWSNGQTTQTATGLIAATYSISSTDVNGCIKTSSVTITQPSQLTIYTTKQNICGIGNNNGTATVNISGGNTPYSIIWNTNPAQTTATATGLISGTYSATITDANGCSATSSQITIIENQFPPIPTITTNGNTTFCQGDSVKLMASAADSYLWSSGVTTQSISVTIAGSYYVIVTDTNGCSNNSSSENITVNATYNIPTTAVICSGDSIFLQGSYQVIAGTYYDTLSSVNSCDSVIVTMLTINQTSNANQQIFICIGDSTFLQGNYQTTSGIYYDTLTSVNGCDSVIATTLTLNSTYSTSVTTGICTGDSIFLQGNYQTSSGIYSDTLQSVNSCDSVIAVILSINSNPVIPTISQNGSTLMCSESGMNSYQWFLNGNPFTSCATQFCTCTQDGFYSVTITNANFCIASSSAFSSNGCNVGIEENLAQSSINISPNPTTGKFTINSNAAISSIEIYNVLGEKVNSSSCSGSGNPSVISHPSSVIDLSNRPKGIYFIKVFSGEKVEVQKIIVE